MLGYKGLKVLRELNQKELNLISDVVIAKDKNVINDFSNEIKTFCTENSINYYFKNSEPKNLVNFCILIGWRWLINLENEKIIVIHDSLLPKLRGFNPLVTALINGDKRIGVTAIIATSQFDKGPILVQKSLGIKYPIKINDAIHSISDLYVDIVKTLLLRIETSTLTLVNQNEKKATYSLWRDDDDYWINWNWESDKIKRFIDAVGYPYLGAKSLVNGLIVRFFDVEITSDIHIENRVPGKVIFKDEESLTIVCGIGLLRVKQIILEDNSIFDFSKYFRIRFK